MIRVLVADDSRVVRDCLIEIIDADPGMCVVGVAERGERVVELAGQLRPSLVTMDVHMPGLDGLEATRAIMRTCPVPIVILSAYVGQEQNRLTFDSIAAGAVDVLPKPNGAELMRDPVARERFLSALRSMAGVAVVRRWSEPAAGGTRSTGKQTRLSEARVVAVGASCGGPGVVADVLARLRATSPPVLLAQHMARGFIDGFVTWLAGRVPVPVRLAMQGVTPEAGQVYVAPADLHLELGVSGRLRLHKALPVNTYRPSISLLFRSVARHVGPGAVGVLLSGMGNDGADALGEIQAQGGLTLVQEPATCVVDAMPRAALACGAASRTASPAEITRYLASLGHVG
jgi:two-component system chemotaxis response regulator CheB